MREAIAHTSIENGLETSDKAGSNEYVGKTNVVVDNPREVAVLLLVL